MIKTIVVPQNNYLQVAIPNSYIGKEIEVLLYSKEELMGEQTNKLGNASRFKGLLTEQEAEKYITYLNQARKEWERDI